MAQATYAGPTKEALFRDVVGMINSMRIPSLTVKCTNGDIHVMIKDPTLLKPRSLRVGGKTPIIKPRTVGMTYDISRVFFCRQTEDPDERKNAANQNQFINDVVTDELLDLMIGIL